MHLLDRPVWTALTTRQRDLALGDDHARRFHPDLGPLAATVDDAPTSLAALATLVATTGDVLLLQASPIVVPPGLVAATTAAGVQMVLDDSPSPAPDDPRIVPLSDSDHAAMLALATLTRPGPFASRTPTLGQFYGIREGDRLLAMAGERMHQPGFTELSGVCTHPDARGRGLAPILSAFVTARILARGDTPYLHAYATNTAAIALYASLGFRLRTPMHVALLTPIPQ